MNYCWQCGAALVETKRGPTSYNTEDGRPRFVYTRRCPKRGRFFSSGHTDVRLVAFTDAEADAAADYQWHDFD